MVEKPASLTAATGMDALTHAIETIVTPGAYPVSDATALAAVKIYLIIYQELLKMDMTLKLENKWYMQYS